MSFSATGRRRPLQSKPKQNPFLKRASSSFSSHARRKPDTGEPSLKRNKPKFDSRDDGDDDERLQNGRLVTTLWQPDAEHDVVSLVHHAKAHMFAEIPERSAGMNSVRIAEVLNFRKNLAPIISIAHLHALSESPTAVDREIAALVQKRIVRRVSVIGYGRGGTPLGDGIVMMSDWETMVRQSALDSALASKYLAQMHEHPSSATVSASVFSLEEVSKLVSTGFMTSTSALATTTDSISRISAFSLGRHAAPVSQAGTSAPTGTYDAVGGKDAVHARGGGTGGLPTAEKNNSARQAAGSLTFAVPGTGAYLRLVAEARAHLLQLLTKSSPKHKEALKDMLRERWDGNILANDPSSRAKRARGEWVGVLPGKTKKWKSFHGLTFEWILEECLGNGAVECFDTGSVGLGVRVSA